MANGMVYLVGAGPGDPGLLTLRGAELLGRADVVIYDGLVNPALLRHARAGAEIIFGGKHASQNHCPMDQETLNGLLTAKAREGKRVARLKGGDPYVFARGGEEAEMLAAAGIPFEVVPGVSSAEAAPNYAGIPLTHRAFCSAYTVITGHEDPGKAGSQLEWNHLAKVPGTLVVLMGLKRLAQIAEALIAHGKAAETPAALIQWGTLGRQKTLVCSLGQMAGVAEREHLQPPVVTVIGEVVRLRDKLNWFEHRPLLGQRVVVTRAKEQAGPLSQPLSEQGAEVLEIPVIKIGAPKRKEPLRDALKGLNSYDWLVFSSPNGVAAFFEAFFEKFKDLRDIGGVRIAAVGPATAAKVRDYHLQVDAMPDEFLAAKIGAAIAEQQSVENLRILLLRAEVANPELPKSLEDLGAIVDDIACYQTLAEKADASGDAARLREGGSDWITFTSGSTVEHFHARFDLHKLMGQFQRLKLASIGPETTKSITALGLKADVEANPHSLEGLIDGILKHGPGHG